MTPEKKKPGYIYFVQAQTQQHEGDGLVKIGYTSNNPRHRLAALQTANPYPLILRTVVRGTLEDEQRWHRRFAGQRKHGEWFDPHPDMPQVMYEGELTQPLVGEGWVKSKDLLEWAVEEILRDEIRQGKRT